MVWYGVVWCLLWCGVVWCGVCCGVMWSGVCSGVYDPPTAPRGGNRWARGAGDRRVGAPRPAGRICGDARLWTQETGKGPPLSDRAPKWGPCWLRHQRRTQCAKGAGFRCTPGGAWACTSRDRGHAEELSRKERRGVALQTRPGPREGRKLSPGETQGRGGERTGEEPRGGTRQRGEGSIRGREGDRGARGTGDRRVGAPGRPTGRICGDARLWAQETGGEMGQRNLVPGVEDYGLDSASCVGPRVPGKSTGSRGKC